MNTAYILVNTKSGLFFDGQAFNAKNQGDAKIVTKTAVNAADLFWHNVKAIPVFHIGGFWFYPERSNDLGHYDEIRLFRMVPSEVEPV